MIKKEIELAAAHSTAGGATTRSLCPVKSGSAPDDETTDQEDVRRTSGPAEERSRFLHAAQVVSNVMTTITETAISTG